MSFDHAFEAYAHQLAVLGWPREWVRRNTPALRKRFAEDPQPFPPPPAPPEPARDRYKEL